MLDAYGWPHDISDEEILERLLALNLERAEAGTGSRLVLAPIYERLHNQFRDINVQLDIEQP